MASQISRNISMKWEVVSTFLPSNETSQSHHTQMHQITHREFYPVSCEVKTNLDCNCTFPIDLAPNGIFIGAKSIEKGNYNLNLV